MCCNSCVIHNCNWMSWKKFFLKLFKISVKWVIRRWHRCKYLGEKFNERYQFSSRRGIYLIWLKIPFVRISFFQAKIFTNWHRYLVTKKTRIGNETTWNGRKNKGIELNAIPAELLHYNVETFEALMHNVIVEIW